MSALAQLLDLARRLEAMGLPGTAVRLRGAALDLGQEMVTPLGELVDAIAEHRAVAGELLAWLDTAREGESDPAVWADFCATRERAREVIADPPGCGWCTSRDHSTDRCSHWRRS